MRPKEDCSLEPLIAGVALPTPWDFAFLTFTTVRGLMFAILASQLVPDATETYFRSYTVSGTTMTPCRHCVKAAVDSMSTHGQDWVSNKDFIYKKGWQDRFDPQAWPPMLKYGHCHTWSSLLWNTSILKTRNMSFILKCLTQESHTLILIVTRQEN